MYAVQEVMKVGVWRVGGVCGGGESWSGPCRLQIRPSALNQARSLPIQPSAEKTPASSFNLDGVQKSALILLDMQMIVLPHIKIMSFFNYRNEKGGGGSMWLRSTQTLF